MLIYFYFKVKLHTNYTLVINVLKENLPLRQTLSGLYEKLIFMKRSRVLKPEGLANVKRKMKYKLGCIMRTIC